MAVPADPYRTLGLPRTASLADVKRAYRHLVKLYHPDSAGEAAMPRFLAIQAAYEAIAGPLLGRRSTARTPSARPTPAWSADPERAQSTWSRTRGGRPARGGQTPGGQTPGSQTPGSSDRAPGDEAAGGGNRRRRSGTSRSGPARSGPGRTGSALGADERFDGRATMGSTSYDGADDEPFEPDWAGGSWYGAGSGTYWRVNPKEYADPRKHGP